MENDILLARSGVRWLVGVCGFRFSSKIFKLRISFCVQCVMCARGLSAESGDTENIKKNRCVVDENMLISHVHNVTE